MYKVFLKNKPLIVSTSLIDNTDLSPLIYSKFSDSSGIIKALKSKKTNCVYFYNSDPEKLMKHLNKKFSIVEAAGGMVVNDKNQYLLIYRNSKWDSISSSGEDSFASVQDACRSLGLVPPNFLTPKD